MTSLCNRHQEGNSIIMYGSIDQGSIDLTDQFDAGSAQSKQGRLDQSKRSNNDPSTTQSTIMLTTAIATTTTARNPSKRQPWNLRSSSVGNSSKLFSLGTEPVISAWTRDGPRSNRGTTTDSISISIMVHPAGFEPAIPSFVGWCLIQFGHGCCAKGQLLW